MFSDIIGHHTILDVLGRMQEQGRVAHAFLFVGPEHVGRTAVAEAFIHRLVETEQPLRAHPDVQWIERLISPKTEKKKTKISVEQIRELCRKMAMSSFGDGWKIAFIEEADRLSPGAANALLKTLEEPHGKTVIILRAPRVESVPATIASRCQLIRFHPVAPARIQEALEQRGIETALASECAEYASGMPGIALTLSQDEETRALLRARHQQIQSLMQKTCAERIGALETLLPKDVEDKRVHLEEVFDQFEFVLRKQLTAHPVPQTSNRAAGSLERLFESRAALLRNGHPSLALEHLTIFL